MTGTSEFANKIKSELEAIGCSAISWEYSGGEFTWEMSSPVGSAIVTKFDSSDDWYLFFPNDYSMNETVSSLEAVKAELSTSTG